MYKTKEPLSIETSCKTWERAFFEAVAAVGNRECILPLTIGKVLLLGRKVFSFCFLPSYFSYECFQSREFPSIPHKQFHKILSIGTNLFPKCQLQRNNFLFGDTIHTDREPRAWLDFPLTLSANFFSLLLVFFFRKADQNRPAVVRFSTKSPESEVKHTGAFALPWAALEIGLALGGNCISRCQTTDWKFFFILISPFLYATSSFVLISLNRAGVWAARHGV